MTPAERLELAAERVHEAWAAEKRRQGWHHSTECRSPNRVLGTCTACHRDLIPYALLPESAKELDRVTVRAVADLYEAAITEALEVERAACALLVDPYCLGLACCRKTAGGIADDIIARGTGDPDYATAYSEAEVKAEREACAKVADEMQSRCLDEGYRAARRIAGAIRARSAL